MGYDLDHLDREGRRLSRRSLLRGAAGLGMLATLSGVLAACGQSAQPARKPAAAPRSRPSAKPAEAAKPAATRTAALAALPSRPLRLPRRPLPSRWAPSSCGSPGGARRIATIGRSRRFRCTRRRTLASRSTTSSPGSRITDQDDDPGDGRQPARPDAAGLRLDLAVGRQQAAGADGRIRHRQAIDLSTVPEKRSTAARSTASCTP